jgi:hypothetical protein
MGMSRLETDVLVLGGGAAGVAAAVAAARQGAQVLLVESQGCLGGSRTAAGVDTFYGFYTPGESPRRIVGGIPWEIVERLQAAGACFERPNTYGAGTGVTYDVEQLKLVYESIVLEAGASLLFHTFACQVDAGSGNIERVVLANKGGLTEVSAQYYIDATGDGDIAARAGAAVAKRDSGQLQSLTTIFFLANVDVAKAKQTKHDRLVGKMKEANLSGKYRLPREDGSWHATPHPGIIQANMVRVSGVDATDPFALTLAEVEGRKQTQEYVRFLQEYVEGFEQSCLVSTSQHIGVRETRRIVGEVVLTEEDVLQARKFADGIAYCGAPVEEHHAGKETRWAYVQGDGVYHIPYRALVPKRMNNLIVAGRCLSATPGALASVRNSAQCMAMGQAAGVATAICAKERTTFRGMDIGRLQTMLSGQGAIL